MTPSENPSSPRSRRPLAAPALAALFAAVALALTGTGGCSRAPTGAKDDKDLAPPKGKPWEVAGQRLKKDTDWASTKLALAGLAADLNSQGEQPLPVIADADFAKLAELVPLNPVDREEVRATTFTAHDSVYVSDCFYLRDVARSLALTGAKPEQQAELAFAWVCRQVYLHPWLYPTAPQRFLTTAMPPTAVLRRGSGSGLERMYVFLALLQQLELDGCLIGRPTLTPSTAEFQVNVAVTTPAELAEVVAIAPRGPFWAVGVRVGADVILFDPWRGRACPFTLNQLKANPDAAKAWFEESAKAGGPTLADAKTATAYLAVPVNALAPRMATVDAKLKAELGTKLHIDARALRDAFPDPKPAFWNPPEEPFAYGRAARSLLPADAGGTDRGPLGGRLFDAMRREQLPPGVFRIPDALVPVPAKTRLGGTAAGILGISFIEAPNPRERIQRGRFQDAAKDLVTKQDAFASGLERLRLNKDADQQIKDWIDTANGLYEDLGRAQLNRNKSLEAEVQLQIENHWRQLGVQFLVDRASSEVGLAEASYLLALCKHEIAERGQTRVDLATGAEADRLRLDATDSWKTALAAWRTYEQLSSAHAGFPGRAAHAQALASRAEKLANPPKK